MVIIRAVNIVINSAASLVRALQKSTLPLGKSQCENVTLLNGKMQINKNSPPTPTPTLNGEESRDAGRLHGSGGNDADCGVSGMRHPIESVGEAVSDPSEALSCV